MELLQDGYYKGRILNYGVKKTRAGDAAPTIAFEVSDSKGVKHKVYWQGSWNGGGMDIAMKALLRCGLTNPKDLMYLADGKTSGLLKVDQEYELEIETGVNQNDPTKKYNRVKWINSGEGKFKDAITVQEFAPYITQRGLVAELIRVAQEDGFTLSNSPVKSYAQPAKSPDDIPF